MLKRYYELTREMKPYEKIVLDELSVDDIAYYLKLRREYEELQNQVVSQVPSVLDKIKSLCKESREKLDALTLPVAGVLEGCFQQINYPCLKELLEVTGELEADAERIAARCARLREIVCPEQNPGRDILSVVGEEAACAREAKANGDQEAYGDWESNGAREMACAREVIGTREAAAALPRQEEQGKRPEEQKGAAFRAPVSPETIKKIEMMVRPKEAAGNSWPSPGEGKQTEKVIKITAPAAAPAEPKHRPPKNHKKK